MASLVNYISMQASTVAGTAKQQLQFVLEQLKGTLGTRKAAAVVGVCLLASGGALYYRKQLTGNPKYVPRLAPSHAFVCM